MRKVVLLLLACGLVAGEEYSIVLDSAEKFNVSWSFEDTTHSSYISFTVTCRTTGWVGLGFSPNGGMTNADIVMAWVADDGTATIMDMYATANGVPVKDVSQDVELISATETNGVTSVTFKRKLHTCDETADNPITSSTTRLIYAYNDADPVNADSLSFANRHSHRGVRSVYLLEPMTVNMEPPSDALTIEFAMNNYNVPSDTDTTYYCSFFDPPQLNTKHHIVSFDTLVQEGNEPVVHHIVLYGCHGLTQEHLRNNNKTEGVCHTDEMPEFVDACYSVVYAWAVGGGSFYYPEKAGYPIGGSDGASPDYYMMEVHYDNPGFLSTWVDSSAIRITYTPTLREEDVGYLQVGSVFGIAVPPRPDQFRVVGYCDGSCTSEWIPETGVELFSYMLHAHLLGVAIQIDWYRNDKHIGVLAEDDNYDFNFQDGRHFKENKKMLPGDTLKITCTYTDPTREVVTYGDFPSSSEMCLAFIGYYPRQDSHNCESISRLVLDSTDPVYEALSVNASNPGGFIARYEVLSEVTNWDDNAVAALQNAYDESSQFAVCRKSGNETYPSHFSPIDSTKYPYKKAETKSPCDDDDDDEVKDKDVKDPYATAPRASAGLLLLFISVLVAALL